MPVERFKSFKDTNENDPASYEGLICPCEEGYLYLTGEMVPGMGEEFGCGYCGGTITRSQIRNAARMDKMMADVHAQAAGEAPGPEEIAKVMTKADLEESANRGRRYIFIIFALAGIIGWSIGSVIETVIRYFF